jgi:hypothetical protein
MPVRPVFRDLDRPECETILARNHVGRVAFSYKDHVDIEPIHYVFADGWLYGRTKYGTKLRTLAHNRWLAFETEEIDGTFDWRSVVVKGALYLLEGDGEATVSYERAVEIFRTFIPHAFEANDPTPDRNVMFRIHIDQITGREASSSPQG